MSAEYSTLVFSAAEEDRVAVALSLWQAKHLGLMFTGTSMRAPVAPAVSVGHMSTPSSPAVASVAPASAASVAGTSAACISSWHSVPRAAAGR